jgi:branched-chain amino acid transport system substrate-binding protein
VTAIGTTYRLWRIRGDFKNDFDLHHYPLDRQRLEIRLFNVSGADRIVYVQDRRSLASLPSTPIAAPTPASGGGALTSASAAEPPAALASIMPASTLAPSAFRNLTQWQPLSGHQLRDVLVTDSALGDPRLVGVARVRERSGYAVHIDIGRRTIAVMAKTLLPLGIMTLIMFASLYFPHALVKEKITVVITAALSGAVLLAAVNTQLGTIGYTMALEYVLSFACCALSRCW